MKYLLVMTACINVGGAENIAVRRREYETAFAHYMASDDPRINRILFVENSGDQMTTLRRMATVSTKRIEFISLNLNDLRPEGRHYGYSEMEMLDHAIWKSRLVKESTHIVKVNGRTIFPGLSRLLDKVGQDYECVVDARRGHVTTQLFLSSLRFYREYLSGAYLEMRDEVGWTHIEHIYFHRLMALRRTLGVHLRFPVNCEPTGKAGHWGKSYDGWRHRSKAALRAVIRVVAPGWRV